MSAAAVRWAKAELGFAGALLAATGRGLCWVELEPAPGSQRLAAWVARHAPGAEVREEPGALAEAVAQLRAYGRGARRAFDLPLDPRGSAFQLRVWEALGALPFGATESYGALALRLGAPGAARAVGRAAGANPLPVVVPCHRLVGGRGLGGFSAGLEHKRRLLRLEGRGTQTVFA